MADPQSDVVTHADGVLSHDVLFFHGRRSRRKSFVFLVRTYRIRFVLVLSLILGLAAGLYAPLWTAQWVLALWFALALKWRLGKSTREKQVAF
jgi:hypothetical protein